MSIRTTNLNISHFIPQRSKVNYDIIIFCKNIFWLLIDTVIQIFCAAERKICVKSCFIMGSFFAASTQFEAL